MNSKHHILFGRKSRKEKGGIQSCAYGNKQACAPSVDAKSVIDFCCAKTCTANMLTMHNKSPSSVLQS